MPSTSGERTRGSMLGARIAVVARAALLTTGVLLLLWWPLSYVWFVQAISPWPFTATEVRLSRGHLAVTVERNPMGAPQDVLFAVSLDAGIPLGVSMARPQWGRLQVPVPGYFRGWVFVPIWQLAVLALAWPVATLVRRWRRGRGAGHGFPIVAADAGPQGSQAPV